MIYIRLRDQKTRKRKTNGKAPSCSLLHAAASQHPREGATLPVSLCLLQQIHIAETRCLTHGTPESNDGRLAVVRIGNHLNSQHLQKDSA